MSKVPESAKRLVRAVLFSEWGVPLDEFAKDFKELEGKSFPYKEYGFSSLRECLETIPDVVRFEFSQEASRWILYAVADETSFMSSFTKKKQLSNNKAGLSKKKRRRHNRSNDSPKGQTDSNIQNGTEFVCNQKGLFSIVIKSKDLDLNLEDISALIQTTAPIVERNSYQSFCFFRYKEREEAEAVIKKFNRCIFNGSKLMVKPASEKLGSTRNNQKQSNGIHRWSQPSAHTPPSLPSLPPTNDKRPDDVLRETALSASPKQPYLSRNGFDPPSKVQAPTSDPNSTALGTSGLNIPVTSPEHASVAPKDVTSSPYPSNVETLPPLLDDDEWEDPESEDWSSSGEEGPPPLVDSSDSEGWSDSDEDPRQPFTPPERPAENGFSMQPVELQIEQMKLKQISPGRGRGLLSFQHR